MIVAIGIQRTGGFFIDTDITRGRARKPTLWYDNLPVDVRVHGIFANDSPTPYGKLATPGFEKTWASTQRPDTPDMHTIATPARILSNNLGLPYAALLGVTASGNRIRRQCRWLRKTVA